MPISQPIYEQPLIIWHPAGTAPANHVKANGAALSRTTYAWLFGKIGTAYGVGDGATTFNVPDLRGEFLRGLDDGRGVDTGRSLGSSQADALQNITGTFAQGGLGTNTGAFQQSSTFTGVGQGAQPNYVSSFDASRVARTAAETRPRNVAGLYCIRIAP